MAAKTQIPKTDMFDQDHGSPIHLGLLTEKEQAEGGTGAPCNFLVKQRHRLKACHGQKWLDCRKNKIDRKLPIVEPF